MKRFKWMTYVFIGVPCVIVLLFILPVTNTIGGIFVLSCVVVTIMAANDPFVEWIYERFFKKGKGI